LCFQEWPPEREFLKLSFRSGLPNAICVFRSGLPNARFQVVFQE
jgi:hypothetical protein